MMFSRLAFEDLRAGDARRAHAATTTLRFSIFSPVIFRALRSAASTTIAVPCWSSWKTGMSSISLRRSSTSKQVGAAMSSRLIPPQAGAMAAMVRIRTSGSFESMQIR